ncbi:DNA polymerase III subunit alpha [Arthrobacter sp. zg-Y1110]|uniref:DNA polymerase III subunit alpha n=1 Tax=Arthrobacter sp. zg-Y1110 TaxID=2886932 RepID=UPI001D1468BF|nr:DNA polymerase III subunit alpha [Arthrobacter sp. zg-Y1110]MCC3292818.1 DNA polymerase III subunit alpha [Arthrobacter sp. zg-Y1110]UWX86757.1 DNA polymerase III subunit alpha [Arthrobacter sp. zg-Y1110]
MTDEPQPDGSGFVHLHNHTENSQLDGLTRVKSVARTAAALGQKALAITDHGSLAAAWKFQKYCLEAGIKPIIGNEMYMAIGNRFERNFETVANDDANASDADEGKEKSKRYMHLTVLARNEAGWKSLLALHNKAEDSHWYKPRIDFDLLDEHGEGLIILTGCLGGPVAGPLARAGAIDKAFEAACPEIAALLGEEDSEELADRITAAVADYASMKQRLSNAEKDTTTPAALIVQLREAVKNFTPALAEDAGDEHKQDLARIITKLPGVPVDAARLRSDARDNLDRLIGAVGREHVFIEVMHHGIKAETHAFRELRILSEETGIPLVATNDCHYEHAGDAKAHDGFLAVGVKRSLDDPKRFKFNGTPDYYLKSEQEMLDVLGNLKNKKAAAAWRQAVANSVMVADLCDDKVIPDPKMRLPKFPVPAGFDSERAYLHHLVKEGAVERYGTDPETGKRRPLPAEVKERLRMEEDIICDMGFPAYFLIVWDMIAWARSDYTPQDWVDLHAGKPVDDATRTRKKPIVVGVGRGSAAGAATSYCMKIVGVDPLENHLLFERFLEPGRAGMPDIDVDFEAARRNEVFVFVGVRWGKDRVAHIGTFGMALSKAAVKDAARILKPSEPAPEVFAAAKAARAAGDSKRAASITAEAYAKINRRAADIQRLGNKLSDLIPSAGGKAYSFAQLDDASDNSSEAFRNLVAESGQDAQDILDLARAFEGVTKTESIHACGFIISPEPLDDIVPMRWKSHAATADPEAPRVICWDGPDCEEIGLLKMDILGLTNLDIASTALDFTARTTGNRFTMEEIPHPNTKGNAIVQGAYNLLAQGRTGGVFQMESGGMIRTAQEVEPETLDDISAIVALFRPGPLKAGMHTSYARRKAGLEPVSYTDFTHDPVETEWIDGVLGGTYGMAIYQETIMRLSTVVSGFNAAQRSRLRKAMGKKKQSEMDACLTMWTEGATQEFRDEDGNVISPVFSAVTAQKLWDFISGAASYLFNASHSAAYGMLAYYTAYLKAGWPVEYAAAILAVADKDDKRQTALTSLREDGIQVMAPDVNLAMARTAPVGGAVAIGLSEVKGVGDAGQYIVAEREANGPFKDMADLLKRVRVPADNGTGFSRIPVSAVQALIEAGALDGFGPRLGQIMVLRAARTGGQEPLDAEWSDVECSARQRARIGTSLGIHPLNSLKDELKAWKAPGGGRVTPLHRIADGNGEPVLTVGVISSWEEKGYSGGRRANFSLESSKTTLNGVIWDFSLSRLRRQGIVPKVGDVVAVSGKVNVRVTVIGDEEAETQETITTKELSINEVWPIDSGTEPEITLPAPVIDFAAKYRQLRSGPAPEPERRRKADTKDAAPAAAPSPSAERAAEAPVLAPVVSIREHRERKGGDVVAILCEEYESSMVGEVLFGNTAVLKSHATEGLPGDTSTEAGQIYRCQPASGETIFMVTEGGTVDPAEAAEYARDADESEWETIRSEKSKLKYVWSRLKTDIASAAAATDEQRLAG